MDPEVARLIEHYRLEPLPVEGTLFVNTYRSAARGAEGRHAGTAIVGLYADDPPSRSLFHRLDADEIWHFYRGDPIRLVLLHPGGESEDVVLGSEPPAGHRVQHVIPAGVWQAGEMVAGGRWALFGCTMAPGFDAAGFEGGHISHLLQAYPDRAGDVHRLGLADDVDGTMPAGAG